MFVVGVFGVLRSTGLTSDFPGSWLADWPAEATLISFARIIVHSLFGTVSTASDSTRFSNSCDAVAPLIGDTVVDRVSAWPGADWGIIGRDGKIIGRAGDGHVSLAYLGCFHQPFPGLAGGSPLDDPDATARALLDRYVRQSVAFLDGLSGHYAIVLADAERRRCLIGSDPVGGRRLFVRISGDKLDFATTLAALRSDDTSAFRLDRRDEDFLLSYEFLPEQRTAYRDVMFLRPGTMLDWQHGELKERKIAKPIWDRGSSFDFEKMDESHAIDALYERFMASVESVAPSANSVAVLLGGFDSALVAAALVRLGKSVDTFTFQFEEYPYNQANVEVLRNYLRCAHHDVKITPERLGEGITDYGRHFNQPSSQAHYPIQTLVALQAMRSRGHHWCLSGDGCDELFLGYPMVHDRAKAFARLGVLPSWFVRAGRQIVGLPWMEDHFGHPNRLARNVLTVLGRQMPSRGCVANRILDDFALARLRGKPSDFESEFETILASIAADTGENDPVRLAYRGKAAVGTNRNRNEGATSGSGISIQSPYQHAAVADFARQIPARLLRPAGRAGASAALGKHVLLRMAETKGLLPTDVIYQPKASPVTAPVDTWYSGVLRHRVLDTIECLPFHYDRGYVEALLRPKLADALFRRYGGIGRYTSQALSMLMTYAALVASDRV